MTPGAAATAAPDRVPLTGADCFLRAFDAEIRRMNGASHVSQLVLRLGPGFDAEAFARLWARAAQAQPMLRARVLRRFRVGAPEYRLAAPGPPPPCEIHDAPRPEPAAELPARFGERLNERRSLRRGELLRCDVVRYAGGAAGTDLAFSWLHQLFDGAGSERFVRWLDECARGECDVAQLPQPDELRPIPAAGPLRERGEAALAWKRWMDGFGAAPLRSPAGPLRRVPQRLGVHLTTLPEDATAGAVAEAGRRAGFLTPMLFYLAAAIRAHHAAARVRGLDPGSYLVPLPVNLRPRGQEGAIFRTHVSLLWFHVGADRVGDLDALIAELKEQRLAAIKAGQVAGGAHAMDFARFAPARLYARLARANTPGELCSFFFAWTGEFLPGLETFCGAEIRNAFHVAPVPPSPGSCLAFSVRAGRLNVTHTAQHGVFSPEELRHFRDSLTADLGAGPGA